MKLNFLSRLHTSLSRIVINIENEACFNEAQEASDIAFWLMFGVAMTIAIVTMYVVIPVRNLLGGRL